MKESAKKKWRHDKINSLVFVWSVLIPVLILYTITSVIPMVLSLVVTFYDWNLLGNKTFVGLKNWQNMLSDTAVWNSFWVTIKYALFTVIPSAVIGLGLALLVNAKTKSANFFKSVFFLPVITSFVVVDGVWKWIFVADENGIINQILGIFGIPAQQFFGKDLALFTVALLGIYKNVGLIMVYYFAGLKGISSSYLEAAKIDGSSPFNTFIHIILPLLKPTTAYVLIVTTSTSLKVFDSIFVLFQQTGGPENVANTLVCHIYQTSFTRLQMGYGSTIAYLLFGIILICSILQYVGLKTETYD